MKKFLIISISLFLFLVLWNRYMPSWNHPSEEEMRETCQDSGSPVNIIVDFSKPSCQDRLYIFDASGSGKAKIYYTGPVLHGCGGKSTARTPEFSNVIGSNCSSLGVYELTEISRMRNGLPCIKLRGLSATNSNAAARHIYIHPCRIVSLLPFEIYGACFPLTHASEGCFTVSHQGFREIKKLFEQNPKMKLYARNGE